MQTEIYTHGKLLLTGEYFVLSGAKALAIPTRFGQRFTFENGSHEHFTWRSYDVNHQCWFEGIFDKKTLQYLKGTDESTGQRLSNIFQNIQRLQANFQGFQAIDLGQSYLEFPNDWGLGSSSTLIAALASWAQIDPYQLLRNTFGGSGYDLACANASKALFYQLIQGAPSISAVDFHPPFYQNLYFVHLGQKQNSREGIQQFRQKGTPDISMINRFSRISEAFQTVSDLDSMDQLIEMHENLVASYLNIPKAKTLHFSDFWGSIKSLGAWGGDFVLATSKKNSLETISYFKEKGYLTILPYQEMILPSAMNLV